MRNAERAESVVTPLTGFTSAMFFRDTEGAIEDEGPEVVIGDFLCNLRHLCRERGWDYEAANARGKLHFEEEVFEEVRE